MKFFHIIQVSESALKVRLKNREALERAVGAAVISVCLGPQASTGQSTEDLVEHRRSIERQGIVRYVDEFAERDFAFFAATDGQLRSAMELSNYLLDEGIGLLAIYKRYVEDEDPPLP